MLGKVLYILFSCIIAIYFVKRAINANSSLQRSYTFLHYNKNLFTYLHKRFDDPWFLGYSLVIVLNLCSCIPVVQCNILNCISYITMSRWTSCNIDHIEEFKNVMRKFFAIMQIINDFTDFTNMLPPLHYN